MIEHYSQSNQTINQQNSHSRTPISEPDEELYFDAETAICEENMEEEFEKLQNLKKMFEKVDNIKPSRIVEEFLTKKITTIMKENELKYDYENKYSPLTDQNASSFYSHELKASFAKNLRKTYNEIIQMHQEGYNKGALCLSYNKFHVDFILAFLKPEEKNNLSYLKNLSLNWTRVSRIMDFMPMRSYKNLQTIALGGNYIESLEMFAYVEMENLENLLLWSNCIHSTKALRKAYLPNLKTLDLHVNKIVDLRGLEDIVTPGFTQLNLDSNYLTNIDGAIKMLSRSPNGKVSMMNNKIVNFHGYPEIRRKKRLAEVTPCVMLVQYF